MADINIKLRKGALSSLPAAKTEGHLYFATIDDDAASDDKKYTGYIYLDSNEKRYSFGRYVEEAKFADEAGYASNADTAETAGKAFTLLHELANTTKFYLSGTTLGASGYSKALFDKGLYTDTTSGHLVANAGITVGNDKYYKFTVGSGIRGDSTGNLILNAASSKNLYFRPAGSSTATGVMVTTTAIHPEVDATYDLGIDGKRFKGLNLSGNAIIGGAATISGDLTVDQTATIKRTLYAGGASNASHVEIDTNKIIAKTNATTLSTLNLNPDGGNVSTGSHLLVGGDIIIDEAVTLRYNATKKALDFIFA